MRPESCLLSGALAHEQFHLKFGSDEFGARDATVRVLRQLDAGEDVIELVEAERDAYGSEREAFGSVSRGGAFDLGRRAFGR